MDKANYLTHSAVPLTVPTAKVFIQHSVTIRWPDGEVQEVKHNQDVTSMFGPNDDHRFSLAQAHAMTIRTRINL